MRNPTSIYEDGTQTFDFDVCFDVYLSVQNKHQAEQAVNVMDACCKQAYKGFEVEEDGYRVDAEVWDTLEATDEAAALEVAKSNLEASLREALGENILHIEFEKYN